VNRENQGEPFFQRVINKLGPKKEVSGARLHVDQSRVLEYSEQEGIFEEEVEASYSGFKFKLKIIKVSIAPADSERENIDFLLFQVRSDNLPEVDEVEPESEYMVCLLTGGDSRTANVNFQGRLIASTYPQVGSELLMGKRSCFGEAYPDYGFEIELLDLKVSEEKRVQGLKYKITPVTTAKFMETIDSKIL